MLRRVSISAHFCTCRLNIDSFFVCVAAKRRDYRRRRALLLLHLIADVRKRHLAVERQNTGVFEALERVVMKIGAADDENWRRAPTITH